MLALLTDKITFGDILILAVACAYAVYAWRIGVPKVLREQNKDLKERNTALEEENRQALVQSAELKSRVQILEGRVHELEAKGTEQIYNLILEQGKQVQSSIDSLTDALGRIAVSPSGKIEVTVHDGNEEEDNETSNSSR